MSQVREEHVFDVFAEQMRTSLKNALAWGDGKLYTTDVRDLDQIYLSGFADPADRQYHNCSACKSFLKRYGGLVVTDGKKTRPALWDDIPLNGVPGHFVNAHWKMLEAVSKARINGLFLSSLPELGQREAGGWTHFSVKNPSVFLRTTMSAGQKMAEYRQAFLTLRRGLDEFSVETFAAVHNLMSAEAAYRSPKFEGLAKTYSELKTKILALDQGRRDIVLWHALANNGVAFASIKSSALGTLYADLQGGMAVPDALRRFKAIVDPRVYQQPTAAPKAGNIKRAEDIFAAMGLAPALERRVATFNEVANRCAWVQTVVNAAIHQVPPVFSKPTQMPGIFSGLNKAPDQAVQTVQSKLSLRRFMEQRSQSAEAMWIIGLDRPHPLGTITTAVHHDAPTLFAWHGNYSWYRWFGVTGKDFNLGTEANVLGILDLPSTWHDAGGPHTGLMFVLEGARDQGNVGSGIPAEGLRSDLYEVKRTIVAHSLNGTLVGSSDQHAAGLIVRKDDFKPFVIRTVSGSLATDHAIVSWE